jgi:8-oxo-dGTP pyrophosphatase MutT (NUDIX family)
VAAIHVKQHPIRVARGAKTELRSQFGALPWRLNDGKIEVLIITSRGTGRWILPKGWPVHKSTPAEAAATEAWEEAGVEGKLSNMAVGFYSYRKEMGGADLPIVVTIFPLRVKRIHSDWPEKANRRRKWVSRKKAAKMLDEAELSAIVRTFDPRRLGV